MLRSLLRWWDRRSTGSHLALALLVAATALLAPRAHPADDATTTRYELTLSGWALAALAAGAVLAALALRRAARRARDRATFVARVSHELRTPLAQITLLADTLRLGHAASDAERARHLDTIAREARRLSLLVDDVLRFVAGERGAPRLAPEPTELGAFARGVVDELRPVVPNARLTVQAGVECWAAVDRDALRQVLLNVLDNAVRHSPPGGAVDVRVTAGADARLTVDDAGPGVPRERREAVFRPFAGSARGTGLGLAVVRELMAAHRGRAWIDDAPGGGARLVLALPRLAAEDDA